MERNIALKRLVDHLVPSLHGVAMLMKEVSLSLCPQIQTTTFDIGNRVRLTSIRKLIKIVNCIDLH